MRREPSHLGRGELDLLIVGGGIYGAWAALDAAQRGLRVGLIERGDFGAETSGNHQRIIHGGLRYLQHADLRRFRESVRERSNLMRIAPLLVRPLPVVVPTMRTFSQRRAVMWGALKVNDLLSADRNRGIAAERRVGRGRLVSRGEAAAMTAGFDFGPYTGGAVFHDAQILAPERLIISILRAACADGAMVANYTAAERCLRSGRRILGIAARDVLSGDELEIRARLVLNCTGPWIREQLASLEGAEPDDRLRTFRAAVLLIRDVGLRAALAVPGRAEHRDRSEVIRRGYRNLFLTPWRGLTLAGTFYSPGEATASDSPWSEADLAGWIAELNRAWPALQLGRDDVLRVYAGFLPRAPGDSGSLEFAKRPAIIDHEREQGLSGFVSVLGVKFTTARGVAARAIDLACRKLGHRSTASLEDQPLTICGGELIEDAASAAAHLEGSELALRGAIERACRDEMACTLADVVHRRTDLAAAGDPGEMVLERCASMMGDIMGWDMSRIEREIRGVGRARSPFRSAAWAGARAQVSTA